MKEMFGSALPTRVFYAASSFLMVQILILIVGTLVRVKNYSSIGLYNRKVKWSASYRLKLCLQCLNIILVVGQLTLCII
jgi:hypothetical protein